MEWTKEMQLAQEAKWIPILQQNGWCHIGGMDFSRDGKIYDFSAADLKLVVEKSDFIIEMGLFVKNENEAEL